METDASTAVGICRRRGLGKIKHLATSDLWAQDRLRTNDFSLAKVPGEQNTADILTKYVDRKALDMGINKMGLIQMSGRPESAPIAMGA